MNTAHSAIFTILLIDSVPAGQHPLVCRFLKGVFHQKHALPRYNVTWDLSILLAYLRSLSPVKKLSLKYLSLKLLMLCLVLSGQRGQTAHLLDVRNMTLTFSRAALAIGDLAKTYRPGSHLDEVSYLAYAPDRRLCIVTVLKHYLDRTLDIRGSETWLFLTLRQPQKAATKDTLRRWAKGALVEAGKNMNVFKPHSIRSASTSFAAKTKLSIDTIMHTAGWHHETTFTKYCNMPIKGNFDQNILSHAI